LSERRIKDIVSSAIGWAAILLAPELEAGNMIAKQLQCLANACRPPGAAGMK
jgi:phosphotransacetylase